MKNFLLSFVSATLISVAASAQPCATTVAVGTSSNAFTNIESSTNAIAVDNDLNTVIFVHRNNAGTFGGHSGQLRYDISTDNGGTWTNNQGVVNPLSVNGTNGARFPQVAIYNPVGNTVPNNAYLSYLAPTVGTTFNGHVSGVRKLDGTGNTETYNQAASSQAYIPSSMCEGANGTMWAMDGIFNGSNYTGYRIYKGIWNGSNDFVWSTNATLTPAFNTSFSGVAQVSDVNIAFDPTGQYGWICLLSHITPGPAAYSFYPIFYRTTDGGNTWSSAMQVDIAQFSCISANITVGNFATCAFEGDLVVDVNGDPHFLTTICNGNNAYAVFFTSWHHMFDITWHAGMFNAMDIANVNAGRGTWGVNPNAVTMDMQPMASRSDDGTKVFFGWCDNSTYTLGQANQTPNIFSRAYDVVNHNWTTVRDFTSCNVATNGQMMHPKMATEVLEPSSGVYRLAAVHGTYPVGDPLNTCSFTFLNNLEWTNADFTIAQPTLTVTIPQGNTWLLCPGSTVGIATGGLYDQVLWSDGATTDLTVINAPGVYSVVVRSGCVLGYDTINVIGVTATMVASSSVICPGDSSLLTTSGNATSYSWNPGNIVNDSAIVTPFSTTTYTLTSGGDGGCTFDQTITITVHPQANVTASASASAVCDGDSASLSASGGVSHMWQPVNLSGDTISVTPASTTTYTVTGTDANGCIDVDSIAITFNTLPTVLATANATTICDGDTATLAASGAINFSWSPITTLGSPASSSTTAFPSVPTDYVVSGIDNNGCVNVDTISINVNALPTVVASHTGTLCETDTVFFTATGASSYLWMPGNLTGANVVGVPAVGQNNYWVTGTDSNGCSATDSFLVFINANPVVTANGQSPVCSGSYAVLAASGASTYFWMPLNTTGSPIGHNPTSTTTHTVIGTDNNGCIDTAYFTTVVNPLPVASLNITTSVVCVDDGTISLTGSASPAGGTFSGNGVTGTNFSPVGAGLGSQTITYVYADTNFCMDTVTDVITVNACVGIAENGELVSSVYPNPFSEQITLTMNTNSPVQIVVRNVTGQQIHAQQFSGNILTLETSEWAAGIYFLTVNSGTAEEQTLRLIKY